jgi:hypothetical protein
MSHALAFVLNVFVLLPVLILVVALFCQQMACVFSNCTSVETFEYERLKLDADEKKKVIIRLRFLFSFLLRFEAYS